MMQRHLGRACLAAFGAISVSVAVAVAVAACGGGGSHPSSHGRGASSSSGGRETIDIYGPRPAPPGAAGTPSQAIGSGAYLAVEQTGERVGPFAVGYRPLDDSTRATGRPEPSRCAAGGQQAAADPKAVAYIGGFDSSCTAASLPILNEAGVATISPANTYVGLTTNRPLAMVAPGEPDRYYPTGRRNFMRLVPRDSVEVSADLGVMQAAGCRRLAVAYDATPYGTGLEQLIKLDSLDDRVSVISETALDRAGRGDRAYAATLRPQAPDCFYFAGDIAGGAVQVVKDVNALLPLTKIFGPSAVCSSAWTNAKLGGVPAAIDPLIECTDLPLPLTAYLGGTEFRTAYTAQYGVANPNPYSIYGYEAMSLVLDTIRKLGAGGDNRADVLAALLATKHRKSVIGTYSFDADGDTSLSYYGLYKVGKNHDPRFVRVIDPAR